MWPGFLYVGRVKTFLRIVCLALALSLAVAPAGLAASSKDEKSAAKTKVASLSKKSSSKSKKSSESGSKSRKTKSDGPRVSGGFRGLNWGTRLSSLPDMDVVEEQGEAKFCKLTGDDLILEGVLMREIVYVFCKGKLSGALIRYDGQLNHLALLARLGEALGTPVESAPNPVRDRSWRWITETSDVMMEYSTLAGTGALGYFATPLYTSCSQPGD